MLDQIRQDLVYGVRRLRQSPGFTLGAVVVLALGLGVNLAEFHIFGAAVFPKVFVRDADSIRRFSSQTKAGGVGGFSYQAVDFFRRNNTVLSAVLTETYGGGIQLEDDPAIVQALAVSGNYFPELSGLPAYGRLLVEDDARPGAPPVVVLGYHFWQRRFGGDPTIVGRSIRLNQRPVQVVGITAHDFTGLQVAPSRLWIPVTAVPYLVRGAKIFEANSRGTTMYGRLRPGVSNAAAEQQIASLLEEFRKQHPDHFNQGERVRADLLHSSTAGMREMRQFAPMMLLMLLILLSACANLGNMLLARGIPREREMEIRLALGAQRRRIVSQLMTENLLLAAIGAGVGLVLGQIFAQLLLRILDAPDGIRIETDWRILCSAAGLVLFATLVFGLAPAIQTVRSGPKASRARQVLIAVQVAASCVLLIVGNFLTQGFLRGYQMDYRIDYQHALVVDPQFYSRGDTAPVIRQNLEALIARLSELPGIQAVTAATAPPLGGSIRIAAGPHGAEIYRSEILPTYFATLSVPIVRGRTFVSSDRDVAIVSESTARAIWPGEDAIGKRYAFDSPKTLQIVIAVVGDETAGDPKFTPSLRVYLPLDDKNVNSANLIVRTTGDPAALFPAVRSVVGTPGVATNVWTMQARMNDRSKTMRRAVTIVGSLGGIVTLLASVGIFGLVSFAVSQRTREIGVRMALGARAGDILRTVLTQHAVPVAAGMICGIALAVAVFQLMRSQMEGLDVLEPSHYIAGVLFFGLIALASALAPATRALRIDPSAALRTE